MARTDKLLLLIGIALSLFGVIIAIDLVMALGAEACSAGRWTANCYPWGAEGPAAESWRYTSKAVYLASGTAISVLPIAATVSLLLGGRKGSGPSRMHRAIAATALALTAALILG
ncbi:hypothetical protein K3165_04150 [Qipengyuania sp. 1XM1-15A]|uniref:hypothetical protein n=1 Tax=Qipengyuania xiamenensis TaxID=2867237 RepID=UPI001C8867C7|nr:hypothetical protein [Qipengyuania xiamenensis]MBX7532111.1 hypothetical protein [Qipengyuania xiamenensis]